MAEALTVEQQKALALAAARKRAAEAAAQPNANGYSPSAVPWLDPINAFANSAVDAIPIAGPWLTDVGHKVDAAVNNMLGFPAETPEDRAQINAGEERQFPIASTAGTVSGTVVPLAMAGSIPTVGRLMGMEGGLPSKVGFGMLSGGAINGADTAMRGGNPGDVTRNALIGAGVGAATPAVLSAGRAAFDMARGAAGSTPAMNTVARGLARDRIDPATIDEQLSALGPDAVVADLGPNLRSQAGAIASLPGQGKTAIVDALTARNAGRNARIQGEIDDILGPAPIPSRVEASLKASRDSLGPAYQQAMAGARAVDTSAIADNLDSLAVNLRGDAQKAVLRARGMLDIPGNPGVLDPHPGALLETRHALDDMLSKAQAGTNEYRLITQVRQQVDALLAKAAPGIKDVDAQYAELARQSGALTQGQQLLDSGRTAVRPAELADMMQQGAETTGRMAGPSAVPFRLGQGARAEIDRIVGTTTNDLNALKTALKGDGSWNRDRLAQLYGQAKADRLMQLLDREVTYDLTYNKALANSETAARQAAQQEMTSGITIPSSANLTGIAANLLSRAANAGVALNSGATNSRIAAALMSGADELTPKEKAILAALVKRQGGSLISPAAGPLLQRRLTGQ